MKKSRARFQDLHFLTWNRSYPLPYLLDPSGRGSVPHCTHVGKRRQQLECLAPGSLIKWVSRCYDHILSIHLLPSPPEPIAPRALPQFSLCFSGAMEQWLELRGQRSFIQLQAHSAFVADAASCAPRPHVRQSGELHLNQFWIPIAQKIKGDREVAAIRVSTFESEQEKLFGTCRVLSVRRYTPVSRTWCRRPCR